MKRHAVILAAALALAACGSDPAPSGDATASGEVLEGSISDAMLPLDSVQSQSPPLENVAPAPDSAEAAAAEEGADSTEEADAAEGGPAPEGEEPAPEE